MYGISFVKSCNILRFKENFTFLFLMLPFSQLAVLNSYIPFSTLIQHGLILLRVIKALINYFKYGKFISVYKNYANPCKISKLNCVKI